MSDLKLIYEDFVPLASASVYDMVDKLLNFENTDDYTDVVEKFGEAHANAIVETIKRHSREEHYQHMIKVKYEEYLIGHFNLE